MKRIIKLFSKTYPVDYPEPETDALIAKNNFKIKILIKDFLKKSFLIEKSKEYSYNSLSSTLVDFGYERTDYVNIEGQFALRGDILDIFLFGDDSPTRIEFFDEEVERIIHFDASSMKTIKELESIKISPLILKLGSDNVTDIAENIVIDEPIKIENECEILK